jgi:hypothetical protein
LPAEFQDAPHTFYIDLRELIRIPKYEGVRNLEKSIRMGVLGSGLG